MRRPSLSRPAAAQLAEDRGDAAGPVHVLHVVVASSARPWPGTAPAGRSRRCRRGRSRPRPPGRRRAGAAPCWSSRPWRRRAPSRSRRPPGWRSRAAARVASSCGRTSARQSSTTVRPASRNSSRRAAWVASVEPLPGSARPSASVRQFIELAVNMPEQEPQVGQAERSMRVELGVGRPASTPTRRSRVIRSIGACATPVDDDGLAGLHRAAGDEDRRDVQPQRGDQHARGDLVAVGDADQRVGAVRVDHVLDRVGDQLAAGQRVEHAAVAHRDAVVDGDRVELAPHAAGLADRVGDEVAEVLEVHVTGHELGEAVRDGDDRLAEVVVGHAGGAPERAGSGHVAAVGGHAGTKGRHVGLQPGRAAGRGRCGVGRGAGRPPRGGLTVRAVPGRHGPGDARGIHNGE